MAMELKLPELGENIESGRVVGIMVKAGDTIEKDQVLMELETDKAVIEVPADTSGVLEKVLVNEGDDVKVGQVLATINSSGKPDKLDTSKEPEKKEEPLPEVVTEKLTESENELTTEPVKVEESKVEKEVVPPIQYSKLRDPSALVPAAPSVRRFAREIGIDIHEVPGSGPAGRISIEDIKRYSKLLNTQHKTSQTVFKGFEAEALPDFSKWGEIDLQPMNKVRETTAKHLSYAWATIPHVTQHDKADITDLEKLRKQFAKRVEETGGKLTITAILIKVIEYALKKYPQFNASVDMVKKKVIFKKYYNIGIAADTDRGLLVPVIKNVNQKNIIQLSVELTELSKKARDRKLSLEEMQGGNFSISNLGGIGGTGFTPVVNSPEVAILGVSRSAIELVYMDGELKPRLMLPLSLSYDHRLIDGADAARFLRWVCEALEQPFLLSLEG